MDLDQALEIIKYHNTLKYTEEELLKIGLTKEWIEQLLEQGNLRKITNDAYQITLINSNKENQKFYLNQVINLIYQEEIEKAIDNFLIYIEKKKNHNKDYFEYIVCLVLKELTENKAYLKKIEEIISKLKVNKEKGGILKIIKEQLENHKFNQCLKELHCLNSRFNNYYITEFLKIEITKIIKRKSRVFDEQKLYELIKNKEYDLAEDLLEIELNKKENKVYLNTIKLLQQRKAIMENAYKNPIHITNPKIFNEFFIALKNKDYRYAQILINKIIKFKKETEYAIYKLLLDDLNLLLDEKEKNPHFSEISKLQYEINEMFHYQFTLSKEECCTLKEKLEQKLALEYNSFDLYCLNIIDMIFQVQENRMIDYESFESLDNHINFDSVLQYGDYKTAITFVEDTENSIIIKNLYTPKQISKLRTLLKTLKNELNKSKRNEEKKQKLDEIEIDKIDEEFLANLIIMDKYEGIERVLLRKEPSK